MKTRSPKQRVIFAVIVICLLIAAGVAGGFALRAYFGSSQAPIDKGEFDTNNEPADNSSMSDAFSEDLASLFGEDAQILNAVDAADSLDVLQEGEVTDEFLRRGFDECIITSEYTMNGDYSSAEEISPNSSEKHPIYEALYLTPSGELWNILNYNGHMMANPVSYNLDSPRDVQLIISENESVTSYVSETNKFYEIIPPESELIVMQVDHIDAATLDSLTVEEIDKL